MADKDAVALTGKLLTLVFPRGNSYRWFGLWYGGGMNALNVALFRARNGHCRVL